MKILLVNCRCEVTTRTRHPKLEHLGLGYLAAVLRENGYRVDILDANILDMDEHLTAYEIMQKCEGDGKDAVIGFTVFANNFLLSMAVLRMIRARGCKAHVTLGGQFVTFLCEEIFSDYPHVSSIVRGEGEYTLLELVRVLETGGDWKSVRGISYCSGDGNITVNPARELADMDKLPPPARDTLPALFHAKHRVACMTSQRGCYMNCAFCTVRQFYGMTSGPTWRERDVNKVVDEMEALLKGNPYHRANALYIWFCVDEFVGPHGKDGKTLGHRLGEEILRRGLYLRFEMDCRADNVSLDLFRMLKEAGLTRTYIGVETFSQDRLNAYRKGCTVEANLNSVKVHQELGINYEIGMIMFDPEMSYDEFRHNHEVIKDVMGYYHVNQPFLRLKLYRATPMERRLGGDRIHLLAPEDLEFYSYEFKDPRIQILWDLLHDVDERNEWAVDYMADLLDEGVITAGVLWAIIPHIRNTLSLFVDEALAFAEKAGSTADITPLREKFALNFATNEKEFRRFGNYSRKLRAGSEDPFELTINGHVIRYHPANNEFRPVVPLQDSRLIAFGVRQPLLRRIGSA